MKKMCGGNGGHVMRLTGCASGAVRFLQMRETPRPQGTAGDARSALSRLRPGRALAHTTGTRGTKGSGKPHRSDVRPPQTPRGARHTGPHGRSGTTPPVPERLPFYDVGCLL
ncbi:hypothetical protein GCM10010341_06010 [Streptomyces noursei]|nr:hypothetical protein GCM10010341_06010 [Streptomyces noursei]